MTNIIRNYLLGTVNFCAQFNDNLGALEEKSVNKMNETHRLGTLTVCIKSYEITLYSC